MKQEKDKEIILLEKGISANAGFNIARLYNNVLVVGKSGSGKTSGYITPNVLNMQNRSFVIVDPKGMIRKKARKK